MTKMTPTERRSEGMKKYWAKKKASGSTKRGPYKKKGKWSKLARAKHSVRMKERYAAKNSQIGNVVTTNKLSLVERLNIMEHHINAIRQQLGG